MRPNRDPNPAAMVTRKRSLSVNNEDRSGRQKRISGWLPAQSDPSPLHAMRIIDSRRNDCRSRVRVTAAEMSNIYRAYRGRLKLSYWSDEDNKRVCANAMDLLDQIVIVRGCEPSTIISYVALLREVYSHACINLKQQTELSAEQRREIMSQQWSQIVRHFSKIKYAMIECWPNGNESDLMSVYVSIALLYSLYKSVADETLVTQCYEAAQKAREKGSNNLSEGEWSEVDQYCENIESIFFLRHQLSELDDNHSARSKGTERSAESRASCHSSNLADGATILAEYGKLTATAAVTGSSCMTSATAASSQLTVKATGSADRNDDTLTRSSQLGLNDDQKQVNETDDINNWNTNQNSSRVDVSDQSDNVTQSQLSPIESRLTDAEFLRSLITNMGWTKSASQVRQSSKEENDGKMRSEQNGRNNNSRNSNCGNDDDHETVENCAPKTPASGMTECRSGKIRSLIAMYDSSNLVRMIIEDYAELDLSDTMPEKSLNNMHCNQLNTPNESQFAELGRFTVNTKMQRSRSASAEATTTTATTTTMTTTISVAAATDEVNAPIVKSTLKNVDNEISSIDNDHEQAGMTAISMDSQHSISIEQQPGQQKSASIENNDVDVCHTSIVDMSESRNFTKSNVEKNSASDSQLDSDGDARLPQIDDHHFSAQLEADLSINDESLQNASAEWMITDLHQEKQRTGTTVIIEEIRPMDNSKSGKNVDRLDDNLTHQRIQNIDIDAQKQKVYCTNSLSQRKLEITANPASVATTESREPIFSNSEKPREPEKCASTGNIEQTDLKKMHNDLPVLTEEQQFSRSMVNQYPATSVDEPLVKLFYTKDHPYMEIRSELIKNLLDTCEKFSAQRQSSLKTANSNNNYQESLKRQFPQTQAFDKQSLQLQPARVIKHEHRNVNTKIIKPVIIDEHSGESSLTKPKGISCKPIITELEINSVPRGRDAQSEPSETLARTPEMNDQQLPTGNTYRTTELISCLLNTESNRSDVKSQGSEPLEMGYFDAKLEFEQRLSRKRARKNIDLPVIVRGSAPRISGKEMPITIGHDKPMISSKLEYFKQKPNFDFLIKKDDDSLTTLELGDEQENSVQVSSHL